MAQFPANAAMHAYRTKLKTGQIGSDEYRQMLIRNATTLGKNGPQASIVMDKVLGENILDVNGPNKNATTRASSQVVSCASKAVGIAVAAKKTNIFVDKRLGDNTFGVTYLGGRDKKPHCTKEIPVKVKPKPLPLGCFHEDMYGTRKLSSQELAWQSGALKDLKTSKAAPPLKANPKILTWNDDGKDFQGKKNVMFYTTSNDYAYHKGHKKRGQGDIGAKETNASLGSYTGKMSSTVRTDFANHKGKYRKKPNAIVKGSSNIFMSWDAPPKEDFHMSTTSDYGNGFNPKKNDVKPRAQPFNGIPDYQRQNHRRERGF